MSCKLYLKRKMSAPALTVQTTSRHRLTLRHGMQGKACLLIAPSFETLSYAHTPTSAHGLLYQLRVLVEACRLPIALTKKKREKAVCLLASITGES